jgi:hypothetical protein
MRQSARADLVLCTVLAIVQLGCAAPTLRGNDKGGDGKCSAAITCEQFKCQNSGTCSTSTFTVGRCTVTVPECTCNGGFTGKFCQKLPEEQEQDNKKFEAVQKAVEKAAEVIKEALEKSKQCPENKKWVCPSAELGTGTKAGMCVGAAVECFANSSVLALFRKEKAKRCNATEGTFEAICAPAAQCSNSTPFRCESWACAENATACEGLFKVSACPSGEIRCPDGACYTGSEMKDCAKAGVLWQGCPPGLQECPGARGGMCGKDANECKSRPYSCPAGFVFCGMQRNTEGKVLMDETTGIPISKCIAEDECKVGRDRDPAPSSKLLDSALGGVLEGLAEDGKRVAMKMNVSKNAFKVGGVLKAVNFSIAGVPDSLVQQGSFGKLFRSGALVRLISAMLGGTITSNFSLSVLKYLI